MGMPRRVVKVDQIDRRQARIEQRDVVIDDVPPHLRVKMGRAAEARAVANIREQFLALHINAHSTLGEVAKSDPQLNKAIDRSLLQAHTFKVEYLADGSVKVRVSLTLHDAWDALRADP